MAKNDNVHLEVPRAGFVGEIEAQSYILYPNIFCHPQCVNYEPVSGTLLASTLNVATYIVVVGCKDEKAENTNV